MISACGTQTTAGGKESEVLMESILDNMPATSSSLKDLTGRYLFANRKFLEIANKSREQMKGKTVFEVAPPDQARLADAHFQKVLDTGKPVEFEETVIYPDGPRVPIWRSNFRCATWRARSSRWRASRRHISERRRMDAACCGKAEERLRTLVEKA